MCRERLVTGIPNKLFDLVILQSYFFKVIDSSNSFLLFQINSPNQKPDEVGPDPNRTLFWRRQPRVRPKQENNRSLVCTYNIDFRLKNWSQPDHYFSKPQAIPESSMVSKGLKVVPQTALTYHQRKTLN